MFGVIISSRPVLTEARTVSPTQVAFDIPAAPSFGHIVVFLLPGNQLPVESGAAVYIQLPGATEFKFLGALSNDKPSAIFKINSPVDGISTAGDTDAMVDTPAPGPTVTLGISVEASSQIEQSISALRTSHLGQESSVTRSIAPASTATTKLLAQRIIANAYNFLAGFSGNVGPNGVEVIPLKSFEEWWRKFEKKIEMDPGFLDRTE